jgi:GNAT superfamily N-acetyltransferase
MNGVTLVTTKKELKSFIQFPYDHYKKDNYWVPPLYIMQNDLVDVNKNPFYKRAKAAFFIAETNGRISGRIAAVHNQAYIDHSGENSGFFGFFECIENQNVANLLIRVALDWLRDTGVSKVIGPASPSMMDEVGVLVEGFESYPSVMMPYSKPYYDTLLKKAGLEKVMDMYAYRVDKDMVPYDRVEKADKIVRQRTPGIHIRRINMKKIREETELIRHIFNAAWEKNWGFTPISKEEMEHLAQGLKLIIDTDFAHVAEINGEPVGFSIALPDINQVLARMNGKLFPAGIFKLLWYKRKINRVRTALMGVLPEHQHKGIDMLMHREAIINGPKRDINESELSWLLETNTEMIRVAERLGAVREKVYRMYGTSLTR